MRGILYPTAGPLLGVAVAWLLGATTTLAVVLAAVAGQAAAVPAILRLERRRLFRELRPALRRRGEPGVDFGVTRVAVTPALLAGQVTVGLAVALIVATIFLLLFP